VSAEAVEASKAEVGTTEVPTAGNFKGTGFKGATRRVEAVDEEEAEDPDLAKEEPEEPRG